MDMVRVPIAIRDHSMAVAFASPEVGSALGVALDPNPLCRSQMDLYLAPEASCRSFPHETRDLCLQTIAASSQTAVPQYHTESLPSSRMRARIQRRMMPPSGLGARLQRMRPWAHGLYSRRRRRAVAHRLLGNTAIGHRRARNHRRRRVVARNPSRRAAVVVDVPPGETHTHTHTYNNEFMHTRAHISTHSKQNT